MKVSGFLFIYFYKLILRYNPAVAGSLRMTICKRSVISSGMKWNREISIINKVSQITTIEISPCASLSRNDGKQDDGVVALRINPLRFPLLKGDFPSPSGRGVRGEDIIFPLYCVKERGLGGELGKKEGEVDSSFLLFKQARVPVLLTPYYLLILTFL